MSRRPTQPLVVYEPFRSIFYAPQFVTLYGGHFAAEGFDVEVRTASAGMSSAGTSPFSSALLKPASLFGEW